MQKPILSPNSTLESFDISWNAHFPKFPLTLEELNKPHTVAGAMLTILDRFGIDKDAITEPPPEESCNEHIIYYFDLIPVINMSRIVKHFVPEFAVKSTIFLFLQPTPIIAGSVLLFLLNLMMFYDERLENIKPYELEIMGRNDQVLELNDVKDNLLEQLNYRAATKGERAEIREKMEHETKQLEEELERYQDMDANENEKLVDLLNENKKIKKLFEQKKLSRDDLIADGEKLRAQRVYDADDVREQAEQMANNIREAEELLTNLEAQMKEKETYLKYVLSVKTNLAPANQCLEDMQTHIEDFNDNLDLDSVEGELQVFESESSELERKLEGLKSTRAEIDGMIQEVERQRQQTKKELLKNIQDEENTRNMNDEHITRATQETEEIKQRTWNFKAKKCEGMEEIEKIKSSFINELESLEGALMEKILQVQKRNLDKLRRS